MQNLFNFLMVHYYLLIIPWAAILTPLAVHYSFLGFNDIKKAMYGWKIAKRIIIFQIILCVLQVLIGLIYLIIYLKTRN